ncbi:MAG TPA: ABC transporter permease [Steroidobacteraceae bacterium]|jgi:putative ABC transport system permease protein|nr:ABC transporter permease [Steroidobacteraceae bacterium]
MSFIRQFLAILLLSLSGAVQRIGSVLTIIIGVACAVGVLVSMLAMGAGVMRQAMGNVRDDRVIMTSVGARNIQSSIPRDEAVAARDLPGIKKSTDAAPVVVFESMVPIEARRRVTGIRVFFPMVGTTAIFTQYRPEIHFTGGREFKPGLHEIIASNPCGRQFNGFDIGERRSLRGIDWTIVGRFDEGQSQQCKVYTDVETLMSAFNRNTYNMVSVMLQSPAEYDAFLKALQANPALHLEARHERDEVQQDLKPLKGILDFASYFVGTIMAIGATLGAVNCLYSIVDSRRREMGTLRAIGFGSAAITVSILCESLLFALPGALLGGALAWAFFNGLAASPFGFNFQLAVTPSLGLTGIFWALGMGVVGGLLPALRASRLPIVTAIRAA